MKARFRTNVTVYLLSACYVVIVNLGAAAVTPSQKQEEQLRNVELTNAAWAAYNKGNYEVAIPAADRCIQRFKEEADRDQNELAKKHAALPRTGKVSADQRKAIFDNGVLNDVATCYWIKGRSAQKLQRITQAREAYQSTVKYSYARTWDPQGWFWSPAEDAADRLKDLK
jgi:tetratricopeptide (TPR) repeat protein